MGVQRSLDRSGGGAARQLHGRCRGSALLIRERHGARQYGLPGGLVPDYESPEETLVREIAIQTDVTAAFDHVVGVRYR